MDKIETARDVAARLTDAERAIDEALKAGADLLGRLATARREVGLSAVVGGEAFERSAGALTALTAARAETAACHDALAKAQIRAGLGAVAVGEGSKDPPPPATLVAEAAQPTAVRRLRGA